MKLSPQPCLENARKKGWNWDVFKSNDPKGYEACVRQGLQEQSNECAYTGLWLGKGTKQKIHIDHFRKKGIYSGLTFVWDNLFVAAKELHCGADFKDKIVHGPKNIADATYSTFWSPLKPDIDKAFWYQQDGTVLPDDSLSDEDRKKAQKTIDMFNLNDSVLKVKRRNIIHQLRDWTDFDSETIRLCMNGRGFSFLVEKELEMRQIEGYCQILTP